MPITQSSLPRQKSKLPRIIFYLLVIALVSVGFWQRQNIFDWWQLRDYTAPISVQQLATESSMTDIGRRIFYVNKPQIQEKQQFYASCAETEATIVLGCYKPTSGIFLLNVTDQRLQGVEQVTAAHEMLHAAYARLNVRERQKVNDIIKSAYSAVTDQSIKDKVAEYEKSDADTTNELHSILATEVEALPAELETYYKRYFTDRSKVVGYANTYKHEFTARKAQVDELDTKLQNLENQITANNQSLDTQQQSINQESARLDQLLRDGKIDEYNTGVNAYNKSLQPFRNLINQTKQLVAEYKATLQTRNEIASQAQELTRALDSRIQTSVDEQP